MELIVLYDAGFNEPIKQMFCDGEFEENSTIRKFRIVQTEGFLRLYRKEQDELIQFFAKGLVEIKD